MQVTSEAVERLTEQLSRLPGIGRKTARRLASFILKMPRADVAQIADALLAAKDNVTYCSICFNITDKDPCAICNSPQRDRATICVVEEASDVMAVERTNQFEGVYHVLGGVISPLDGIGPDELRIADLVARVARPPSEGHPPIAEVILAVNPNVEGDTTAYYIGQLLEPFEVKVSRLAHGIPVGSDLEFADEATLGRAIEGRTGL